MFLTVATTRTKHYTYWHVARHPYLLVTLKRSRTTCKQLLKFYTTFFRPGLEYAASVWHSGITQKLSDNIERVQQASLSIIHPELSYKHALEKTGLSNLHARREYICVNYPRSLYGNPAFNHWFPPQRQNIHNHSLRTLSRFVSQNENLKELSTLQPFIYPECSTCEHY